MSIIVISLEELVIVVMMMEEISIMVVKLEEILILVVVGEDLKCDVEVVEMLECKSDDFMGEVFMEDVIKEVDEVIVVEKLNDGMLMDVDVDFLKGLKRKGVGWFFFLFIFFFYVFICNSFFISLLFFI